MSNQNSFVESTFKKLSKTNNNIVDDESTFKKLIKTNNNIDSELTFKKLIKINNNIDSELTFKKLIKINNNIDSELTFKNISITPSHALPNLFPENDEWNEKKNKEAREAYTRARDCGSYDYYRFIRRDFPEDEEELVKCPTCEEMIYSDEQNGMCYTCFKNEEKLYPDDIPMELRYRN
jgi:hypothetical protein